MSMNRCRGITLSLLIAIGVSACQGENPLIGTWRLDRQNSGMAGAYAESSGVGTEIVFDEGEMTMKNQTSEVKYEVEENSVRVVPEDGSTPMVLRVVGGEYFLLDTPLGQPMRFVKVEGGPAAEPAATPQS